MTMENEKNLKAELKLEDLETVAGGAERPFGMPCPQCNGFMPLSREQIITEKSVTCPHCGLRLNINHQENQAALEALKNFQQWQKELDQRRN